MTYQGGLLVMVAVAVVLIGLMLWGWTRRRKRDAQVEVPLGEPVGSAILTSHGFYVATTKHDEPLNRIAARPLAFRSRVDVTVTEAGLAIALAQEGGLGLAMPGERPVFIPASRIDGAGRATWTIDRVVERDGLVLVAWSDGSQILDTYVRLQDDDPAALVAAIDGIRSAYSPMGAHS